MGSSISKIKPKADSLKVSQSKLKPQIVKSEAKRPDEPEKDAMAQDPNLHEHLKKLSSSINSSILQQSSTKRQEYSKGLLRHNQLNREFIVEGTAKGVIPVSMLKPLIEELSKGEYRIARKLELDQSTIENLQRVHQIN